MNTKTFLRTQASADSIDKTEAMLWRISEYITTIVFGLLPLLFIPVAFLPLDYGKVVIAIVATLTAILFASLAYLRSGGITISFNAIVAGLWVVAGVGALSSIFSGDPVDSFIGDVFEVNTTLFLILLALVASLTSLMRFSKMAIMRFYVFLTGSAAVLAIYHVLRLVFGPEFLSFGVFTDQVSTSVGSWNDLGLFFGLSVLLSMVALEQLPLTKWGRVVFTLGIILSLIMLAVINFSAVWWVLGLVSLVMLMYTLVRDRFSDPNLLSSQEQPSLQSTVTALGVFVVSLLFILAGGPLGGVISQVTGVSHLEVRPSFTATTEIARSVYTENAFFGTGPNKFIDAWREYKNPAINQTIFWNTDFRGGNGFVTTHLVTTGIIGILAWLAFFGLFLYGGFKMLFRTEYTDRFWYFIASSSFVAATFLWGMSLVYLPGATILILAAMFTAIMLAAYFETVGSTNLVLSVRRNRRAAIVLVGIVMIVVVGSVSAIYFVGRHYSAVHTYASALNVSPGTTITEVEQKISEAFSIYQNDTYARQVANYQLNKIDTLLTLTEPTAEQQEEFQKAVVNGINSAQRATELDPTDAANWATLGRVYSVLVAAGEDEVIQRAAEAFTRARELDPTNPSHLLLEAQLQIRAQNPAEARSLITEAISLKANYSEALNFLTQLEVAEGRTDEAIAATRSIIAIEPNNPARHYQLAILLSAKNDVPGTIIALERAVELNNNYANARYLLALAYAQEGRTDEAIDQLEVVLALNPNNETVVALLGQLRSGEFVPESPESAVEVNEPETVSAEETAVTATEVPDTSLISPVNTVPETSAGEDEAPTVSEEPESVDEEPIEEEVSQ